MSRSRLSLLLIVLLLGALWYAWQETPRQQKVASSKSPAENRAVSATVKTGSKGDASLDFNGGEKLTYNKPKRDLFRPLYRAPIVVKKPIAPPPPPPVVIMPAPPPPPPPRPFVKPVAGPKPIPPLKVLGFLHKGPNITVFLASRQGDLYLVKKGERFADGLLVRELDESKIVISRGADDTGVTLPVGDPKTQRMAIPDLPSGRPSVPGYKSPAPKMKIPTNRAGQN